MPTGKVDKPSLCQKSTATSTSTSALSKATWNSCPVTRHRSLAVKRNTYRSLDEGSYSAGAELWVDRGLLNAGALSIYAEEIRR